MFCRYVLLLIFFGYCFNSFSQEVKDSTERKFFQLIEGTNNDSIKVDAYIKLGNHFLSHDFTKSETYFNEAVSILDNSPKLLTIQRANVLAQLGVVYKRRGDYPLAMEYYLSSKQLFEKNQDASSVASLLHNIAMIYRDQREYKKAIKDFKKVIKIKQQLNERIGAGIAYNMLGVVYRKDKQLDSASINYKKAKGIFIEEKSKENLPRVNSNLAALLHYQKKYEEAIELHKKNIEYYTAHNKLTSLFNSHFNISKTYLVLNQFKKSLVHIDKALVIAERLKLKDKLSRGYLRKSTIYSQQGEYQKALEFHKVHKKYSDSVYSKKNVKKLERLELTYKFKQEQLKDSVHYVNQKRILRLEKKEEANKKWLYFSLFIITVLLGIIASYLLIKKNRKKSNKIKVEFFQKEKELNGYIKNLLNKIDKQEELLNKNLLIKEDKDTKKLHDKIAAKILTQDDWYNFKEKFNQVYPLFFNSIKDKGIQLTKSEQRLVALEKLGLDNNQIAKVLGISVDSVFVNRYRLRKKINAPKEISIVVFLEK